MPNILIRDLSPETISLLKARAHRNGRSMQSELKSILDRAAQTEALDAAILSARIMFSPPSPVNQDSPSGG